MPSLNEGKQWPCNNGDYFKTRLPLPTAQPAMGSYLGYYNLSDLADTHLAGMWLTETRAGVDMITDFHLYIEVLEIDNKLDSLAQIMPAYRGRDPY